MRVVPVSASASVHATKGPDSTTTATTMTTIKKLKEQREGRRRRRANTDVVGTQKGEGEKEREENALLSWTSPRRSGRPRGVEATVVAKNKVTNATTRGETSGEEERRMAGTMARTRTERFVASSWEQRVERAESVEEDRMEATCSDWSRRGGVRQAKSESGKRPRTAECVVAKSIHSSGYL